MSLQVIGAGFGRTGTLSMKAALEQLGYVKCHHMVEVLMAKDSEQLDYWDAVGQGERPGWDAIFEGYQASVDFPSSVYWKELAEAYPEAKVVLTVRSFESWYKSAAGTIYAVGKKQPAWTRLIPKPRKIDRMAKSIIWDGKFDGKFEDKAHAESVWNAHIEEVKSTLPAERLLVFEVKDGWGPLCAFLDKPVPEGPFPRVNDTEQFHKMIKGMTRLAYVPGVAAAALAVSAIAAYTAFQ
ncbi:MAG: sulfotransferase family protein [Pseudomonadota bacterium]